MQVTPVLRAFTRATSPCSCCGAAGSPAGGGEEAAGESAKEKEKRLAKEKRDATSVARELKAAQEAEIKKQEIVLNLEEAAMIARSTKRERELAAITFDAQRKALTVKGTESEKHAKIALINAEAQVKKQEMQAKFDEEDRNQQQQHLADLLADEDAAEVEREADFQAKFKDDLDV